MLLITTCATIYLIHSTVGGIHYFTENSNILCVMNVNNALVMCLTAKRSDF